jgi:hypothetical protein
MDHILPLPREGRRASEVPRMECLLEGPGGPMTIVFFLGLLVGYLTGREVGK